MTPLAARLGDRQVPAVEDHQADEVSPLSAFRPKETVRVVGCSTDLPASHRRRLYDLGFAPGVEVQVVRRAPARDPWVYRVAGIEIALRRSLAKGILAVRA